MATLHGVVFDILVGGGLPSRSSLRERRLVGPAAAIWTAFLLDISYSYRDVDLIEYEQKYQQIFHEKTSVRFPPLRARASEVVHRVTSNFEGSSIAISREKLGMSRSGSPLRLDLEFASASHPPLTIRKARGSEFWRCCIRRLDGGTDPPIARRRLDRDRLGNSQRRPPATALKISGMLLQ